MFYYYVYQQASRTYRNICTITARLRWGSSSPHSKELRHWDANGYRQRLHFCAINVMKICISNDQVSHDSSLSVLPVAWVQFPATAEYSKGFFPGWSRSANPSWARVAENGSISPQWHHTTCGQWGGRPKSNHGQTMADRKKKYERGCPRCP